MVLLTDTSRDTHTRLRHSVLLLPSHTKSHTAPTQLPSTPHPRTPHSRVTHSSTRRPSSHHLIPVTNNVAIKSSSKPYNFFLRSSDKQSKSSKSSRSSSSGNTKEKIRNSRFFSSGRNFHKVSAVNSCKNKNNSSLDRLQCRDNNDNNQNIARGNITKLLVNHVINNNNISIDSSNNISNISIYSDRSSNLYDSHYSTNNSCTRSPAPVADQLVKKYR